MAVSLYQSQGNKFLSVDVPGFKSTFAVDKVNQLSGTKIQEETLEPEGRFSLEDKENSYVRKVHTLANKCATNIERIGIRLGVSIAGENFTRCRNFENMLQHHQFREIERLNLSNLEIDYVPPQLELLKHLKYLDLSNNQIRTLPYHLSHLNCLVTIDLRGNPIIELPQWVYQMPNLTILKDEVESSPDQITQA